MINNTTNRRLTKISLVLFAISASALLLIHDTFAVENRTKLYCQANGYAYQTNSSEKKLISEHALSTAEDFAKLKIYQYLTQNKFDTQSFKTIIKENDKLFKTIQTTNITSKTLGKNIYGMRIIAEVIQLPKRTIESGLLNVKITTDKNEYRDGNKIQFKVQGNKNYYMCLLDKNPEGNIVQLIPNSFIIQNNYKANKQYLFPNYDNKTNEFNFVAQKPFGNETVHLFASDIPICETSKKTKQDSPLEISSTIEMIREKFTTKIIDYLKSLPDNNTFECVQFKEMNIQFTVTDEENSSI